MGFLPEFWRRHRRLVGAAVSLLAAGAFLVRVRGILPPFVLAAVLAYILNPLVNHLVRHGFSRLGALVFVYAVVIMAGGVALGLLVPAMLVELGRLADFVPGYFASLQELAGNLQARYSRVQLPQPIRQAIDEAIGSAQRILLRFVAAAAQAVLGLFSALFSLALAPVLSFYLLKDLDRFRSGVRRLIPPTDRAGVWGLLSELSGVVSGFIRGQLTVAALVGLLVTGALALLGIRFAVLLGLVAGVAEIIPYFGPVIGAIPALAVAAAGSPLDLVKVAVAFIAIQQVESVIIAPRIIGDRVGLHPLGVIFALLAGFELYGVAGMIGAVPAAGMLRVLLLRWLAGAGRAPPGPQPGQRGQS
jgi:predicted PurR-regulated permease PerM